MKELLITFLTKMIDMLNADKGNNISIKANQKSHIKNTNVRVYSPDYHFQTHVHVAASSDYDPQEQIMLDARMMQQEKIAIVFLFAAPIYLPLQFYFFSFFIQHSFLIYTFLFSTFAIAFLFRKSILQFRDKIYLSLEPLFIGCIHTQWDMYRIKNMILLGGSVLLLLIHIGFLFAIHYV